MLAAEAERHPAWELYAAYCRDRLRGLRKQALSRLDEFLQQAQNWPFPERREFVDWLCSKLEKHGPLLTAPLPRPLLHSLIRPTLSEWAEADPDDPRPHRWQGIFRVDDDAIGHLRHAIAVDPTEQLARIRLAQLLISRLEHSAHYLPEYYIGDPEEDLRLVDEAKQLVEDIKDARARERLRSEVEEIQRLIRAWLEFKAEGHPDFKQ